MIEPIDLTYDLHLLPLGRWTFQRWRYELWHGPRLLSAGWRLSAQHAQQALRDHAVRYAHRLHGLHPLHPERTDAQELGWGDRVAMQLGDVRVMLTHRALLHATG